MKTTIAAIVLSLSAVAAHAQTVYEPVKYQHGRHGETFYGGANPYALTLPGAVHTPGVEALQQRFIIPANGGRAIRFDTRQPIIVPQVFSDVLPYTEVSQYGFSRDDARNEAYANVPRFQTTQTTIAPQVFVPPTAISSAPLAGPIVTQFVGTPAPAPEPAATEEPRETVGGSNPAKAVPLLNWARNERNRNPALYRALLKEARKHDPAAVERLERE